MAESSDRSHAERVQEILHRWRVLLAEPQPRADPVDKEGSKSPGTGADERGPAAA